MTKKGRPTKLTPEIIEQICNLIRTGLYIETACNFVGISKDTYYRWAKEGARAKSGIKKEFSDSVKKAVAFSEANLIGRINEAGKQQWQAYAWIAERRFPERWAKDRPIEGAERKDIQIKIVMDNDDGNKEQ